MQGILFLLIALSIGLLLLLTEMYGLKKKLVFSKLPKYLQILTVPLAVVLGVEIAYLVSIGLVLSFGGENQF